MKVLIAGDFCPQHRTALLFDNGDFSSVLEEARSYIQEVDYAIVNFECPVCQEEATSIFKYGPNLRCRENGIEAIKWCGFNCVTLANNHFLDYGKDGVDKTLEACNKYGIDIVGGGRNLQEASRILYKEIEEKTLALINCCEHEFSIASEATAGCNPLNPIQQYYSIQEAKKNADIVIVIVHGGHEQYNLPSPRMKELYRFFVDSGADAVVNHHQHCYSGYELYKGKPIFYGLGNFCFDIGKTTLFGWPYGYMVSLNFNEKDVTFELLPYKQCKEEATIRFLPKDSFDKKLAELNAIISNDSLLKEKVEQYYKESMQNVAYTIEPIQNRYIAALQHRKILPSSWSKQWLIKLQNYVLCEAHHDKLEYFFKHFFDK